MEGRKAGAPGVLDALRRQLPELAGDLDRWAEQWRSSSAPGTTIAAALLVGELLGHPYELERRAAFAREAIAAGRVPDAAALASRPRLPAAGHVVHLK